MVERESHLSSMQAFSNHVAVDWIWQALRTLASRPVDPCTTCHGGWAILLRQHAGSEGCGCFVVFGGSVGLVGLHSSPITDDKDSLLMWSDDDSSHVTSCQAFFDTTAYCKGSVFATVTLSLHVNACRKLTILPKVFR